MKFPAPVSVQWIADMIHAEVAGNTTANVLGINEIHKVEKGDLVFVDHPKYYDTCLKSAADFIIINTREVDIPEGKAILVVADPFEAYLTIVKHFRPFVPAQQLISDDLIIGEGSVIMPNSFVGKQVRIGRNTIIHPNVTILDYTMIGDNVVIQSGTVIGGNGFLKFSYCKKPAESVFSAKIGVLSMGYQILQYLPLSGDGITQPLLNAPMPHSG